MTPPSPLSIAAGNPQTATLPTPGSPNLILPPRTNLYDPRNAPPEDPLVQALRQPLQQMLGGSIRPSVTTEKIWLNAQYRRSHYYWEGQQYLTLSMSQFSSSLIDYKPISSSNPALVPSFQSIGQFADYVLNIFRGDIRKFEAVIGTRAPNVAARTRDPNDENQTTIRRLADRVSAYLDSHWHTDALHRELVHYLALYGNAFSYTRHVADKQKYGTTNLPLYTPVGIPQGEPTYHCLVCGQDTPQSQVQASGQMGGPSGAPQLPLCPRCANPLGPESLELPETIPGLQLTEMMEYENGAVEIDLVNGSMVTFPFWEKCRGASVSHVPWWIYEFEIDKGRLARIFPQLKSKIYRDTYGLPTQSADMTGQSSSQTRRVLQSPIGAYNYTWSKAQYLYTRCWLPPSTIEYLPGDDSGNLREQLLSKYPTGILSHYVNGELMRVDGDDLGRGWAVAKVEPSDTIYTQPYFHDYIQGQDTINDMLNALINAAQRSTGAIIFDPQVLDPDRIREFAVQQGEYIPAVAGQAGALPDAFFKVPAAEINPLLWDMIDRYIEKLREISGIRPEIFGGGDAPTARQAEMNKNQALMQLNTVWNEIRTFWAQTYENATLCIAEYSRDGRLFQSRGQGQSPDMISVPGIDRLADGGWFYECEEAFPMSVGQRKDFYMNLMELGAQNPIIQQDLASPANRQRMAETIGSPDWRVTGVREREMILRFISKLSKEQPIIIPPPPPPPPVQDPATGLMTEPPPPEPPPPPQPSQQFTWDLFSSPVMGPDFVVEVIREWATDDAGQELYDQDPQGQAGWGNVMAFLGEAVQKAQPPPPPPPPIKRTVSMNIAGKDIPLDATEKVMEDVELLPPNSPPFSTDPQHQQAQQQQAMAKMASAARMRGGKPSKPKTPSTSSDDGQPPNPMAAPSGPDSLASPPPGQGGLRPLGSLLPPPPSQ